MATYQEMIEQLQARSDDVKKKRAARDEKEMAEKVFPLLNENPDYDYLRAPDADPDFPGHVVLRPPKPGEVQRVRHMMFRERTEPGALEGKAKASLELGAACVVYPPRDEYERLTTRYPNLASEVGTKAWKMAEAGADALVKG